MIGELQRNPTSANRLPMNFDPDHSEVPPSTSRGQIRVAVSLPAEKFRITSPVDADQGSIGA
jgi:hypothetical protein